MRQGTAALARRQPKAADRTIPCTASFQKYDVTFQKFTNNFYNDVDHLAQYAKLAP